MPQTTVADPPAAARELRAGLSPLHVPGLLAVAVSIALWAGRPLQELDAAWHVMLGREIIVDRDPHAGGTSWLAVVPPPGWHTSQWLSEVLMAGLVDTWGWRALLVAGVASLASALILVAVSLRRLPAPVWLFLVITACICVTPGADPRPATFVLPFLVLLATLTAALMAGRISRPAILVPTVATTSLVWAQAHGSWILAPLALALLMIGILADRSATATPPLRPVALAFLASWAGLANPLGPESLLLPLKFSGSTSSIGEWQPTTFEAPYSVALLVLLGAVVTAWARGGRPVPRREVLWVVAWTAFATIAARNVVPAFLLLLPVAGNALARAWSQEAARVPDSRTERRLLTGLTTVLLVAALGLAVARLATVPPLAGLPAKEAAAYIARQSEPVRVLNAWNVSGTLAGFGGGNARLVVDGRADLWGNERADRLHALIALAPGWKADFHSYRPDVVVVAREDPLFGYLTEEAGWRDVSGGSWPLIVPPVGRTAEQSLD